MNPRLSCLLVVVLITTGAEAAQRTFVSAGSGSDANPCTRSQPCRQFAAAMAQTNPGGEVVVLDSGGYGVVSITQAVSLISPAGVYAGITAFELDAITVNVNSAVVVLRGLSLNGLGGDNGITFTGQTMTESLTRLYVENCVISGFGALGVDFARNGILLVSDTIVRQNGGGIHINGSPGLPSRASIDHALLEGNGDFGLAVQNASVAVRDSVAAANAFGFRALANAAGTTAELSADNCQATHNEYGFYASGFSGTARLMVSNSVASANFSYGITATTNGTVRASNNTVTRNGLYGLFQSSSGVFESRGNNTVRGNTTETFGTITTFAPM